MATTAAKGERLLSFVAVCVLAALGAALPAEASRSLPTSLVPDLSSASPSIDQAPRQPGPLSLFTIGAISGQTLPAE